MVGVLRNSFFSRFMTFAGREVTANNLSEGKINRSYIIRTIKNEDEALANFLFSLGCYEGEVITLISNICDNYVINIKDARYSIDKELASAVLVDEI